MRKIFILLGIISLIEKQSSAQLSLDKMLDSGVLVTGGIHSISIDGYISDGKGGAIVLFQSDIQDSLFIQHISSAGKLMWGTPLNPKIAALKINPDNYYLLPVSIIPDEKGGVFFSYIEEGPTNFESYLQHIDSNGNALMGTNGVKIQSKFYEARYPVITSDGGSGIIVSWTELLYDFSNSKYQYAQVFAQKYSSTGLPQWPNGGIQVCSSAGMRRWPVISADGNKGAIISFEDSRNCNPVDSFYNLDLYAQKIDSNGNVKWSANALPVSLQPYNQSASQLLVQPDKQHYIISYTSQIIETYSAKSIHVQQLTTAGSAIWSTNGVILDSVTGNGHFSNFKIVPDSKGGSVVFWGKYDLVDFEEQSFIQRIDSATGNFLWPTGNINLLNEPAGHAIANDIIDDGAGNFIYSVWPYTNDSDYSRFQKVNLSGSSLWGSGGKDFWFLGEYLVKQNDGSFIALSNPLTSNTNQNEYSNIVAYKMDKNGNLLWNSSAYKTVKDGDWDDPSVWETGVVPTENTNVVITTNVLITSDVVCNSLKVLPGFNVTLVNGAHLAVLH